MMRRRISGSLLFLLLGLTTPAFAELKAISISPAAPSTCDPVTVTVTGELPACYEIVGAVVRGPAITPCMTPEPCETFYRIELTVRAPDPAATCPTGVFPYTRTFDLGRLPWGPYSLVARERIIPFAADSTDSFISESSVALKFAVTQDLSCTPELGCYILSFHNPLRDPPPGLFCDAGAAPGGTACLPVNLTNSKAVGGLQTTIVATAADGTTPADPFLHPVSVEATGRAPGFEVTWVAEGSRAKVMLYPLRPGAEIARGDGPVLQICYSVAPETPPQTFLIQDTATIVADTEGVALPICPTFAIVGPGRICVTAPAPSCDLNGDGVSDVLDIIRLVRCALASTTDTTLACPDSVAARADCNGDGSIDIRDVICCVRKIIAGSGGTGLAPAPVPVPVETNTIGFEGPVRWIDAATGVAVLRLDASTDWGGTQFSIDPGGAPVRVHQLKLMTADPGDQLEWTLGDDGIARAILYAATTSPRPSRTVRIGISLARTSSGAASGALVLRNVRAGYSTGEESPVAVTGASAALEGAPVASPALLSARPNPFAGQTEIAFVLPVDAPARLNIYDVRGRLVRSLVQGPTTAGVHRIPWNGMDDRGKAARSGIYFAKLMVGSISRTERLMLLR